MADLVAQYSEGGSGVGKTRVLADPTDASSIDDRYNLQPTTDRTQLQNRGGDDDKRSAETIKREEFLSIVKPGGGTGLELSNEEEPNIERDGVKFKQEFELQTSKQP